jgi:hypothetical protein
MAVKGNTYPPFCALFHVPFAAMPLVLAKGVWVAIIVVSFVYFVRKSWQHSGGMKLEENPAADGWEHATYLLGLAVSLQFALNVFSHLQTDLLIAALLTAGCAAIAGGRYFQSALWIGVAAAFKATPLLFAPYLMWRRKWVAAACLIAVTIGLNLLPDLVHRPPDGGTWAARWFHRYVQPMSQSDYAPGNWNNQLVNNQSIAGAVRRWFATSLQKDGNRLDVVEHPEWMSASTQRKIFLLLALGIVLPVLYAGWRTRKDDSPALRVIECGMVMLLMLLLSPNSSRAHFCIMLLPAFCIARFAMRQRNAAAWALLLLSLICSTLSIHLRLPGTSNSEQFLLWLGVVMFAAVFLLAACVVALLPRSIRTAPAPLL